VRYISIACMICVSCEVERHSKCHLATRTTICGTDLHILKGDLPSLGENR